MNDTVSMTLTIVISAICLWLGAYVGSRTHSNMQDISMVCKDSNLETVVTTVYESTTKYPTFKVTCK